jgi:ATP-dependent Lon protease
MELVRLDGYTDDEKVVIARHHLLPRQLERAGLRPGEVDLPDAVIQRIVTDYTREAGVRSLERELGKLLRKLATKVAAGAATGDPVAAGAATGDPVAAGAATGDPVAAGAAAADDAVPLSVSSDDLRRYLGRAKFHDEVAERTDVPGVATGLAVTGAGGDVLFIEASAADGEPGLTLTGQLGDVMKESAQIALSYVRAHAGEYAIDPVGLGRRIHIHVPAGAVPKDGPSAGITMTTALVSLLTGRRVKSDVGMTGEVTLQGKVLPIGGVKQKVLAAHRAGLTEVILPQRNGPDLEDVPERVRDAITFHLADTIEDVLTHALAEAHAS